MSCSSPQSRTGGVLGAVPSAAVMGARRIFPGGQIQGCKKLKTFLVITLNTRQVFAVTTNAQNTLQHFQRGGASALKTCHFSEGGACVHRRGT